MKLTMRSGGIALGLVSLGLSTKLIACSIECYSSVHFNTYKPDFGLPVRPFTVEQWGEQYSRRSANLVPDPNHYSVVWFPQSNAQRYQLSILIAQGKRYERFGHFRSAARVFAKALVIAWKNRSGIQDRIEVLRQVTHKTNRELLSLYLHARDLCDAQKPTEAQGVLQRINANSKSGYLRAHASYTLAALQYDCGYFRQASVLYEKCARDFPSSPRREPALLMAAISLVRRQSRGSDTGVAPPQGDVKHARRLLWKLLDQYPDTRFKSNAIGWLGRCDYIQKRYPEAMRYYLLQAVRATSLRDRVKAISSMKVVRGRMTASDAKRLGAILRSEPILVAPYLEYRVHHAHDDFTKPDKGDLANIANLARSIVRRSPRTKLPPSVLARLAEINYRLGRYRDTLLWIQRALSVPRHDNLTDHLSLAYYLRGSVRGRSRNVRGAIRDFETIVRRFPQSYLANAARENLAILYEERGNLGKALEQYFALQYDGDIAFLIDARMTIDELEKFVVHHPRHPKRKLLLYSLGMRCLRTDMLEKAERVLRGIPSQSLKWFALGKDLPEYTCGVGEYLMDPLASLRDLRRLNRDVQRAKNGNARAQAMYVLASYYYRKRNLLFYNPALWQGDRSILFSHCWNTNHATREDDAHSRSHHYEHECVNRTRRICLALVARYPKSPIAADALYRAACCARRLAYFDNWWRSENKRHNFWAESVKLMNRLTKQYPKHHLAKSARKYAGVFENEWKMYFR